MNERVSIFVGIDDAAFYLNASIMLRNPKTGSVTSDLSAAAEPAVADAAQPRRRVILDCSAVLTCPGSA